MSLCQSTPMRTTRPRLDPLSQQSDPRRAGNQQYATATGLRRGQQRIDARQLTLTLIQSNWHHANTPRRQANPANAVPFSGIIHRAKPGENPAHHCGQPPAAVTTRPVRK